MKKVTIEVKNNDSQRLDIYTTTQLSLSRAQIHRLIKEGAVQVNSQIKKSSYKVCIGDVIELSLAEPKASPVTAQPLPLEILWEDEHIIVVNKPPSMVVYPAAGHLEGTLLNGLLYRYNTLAGSPLRPGIVHRLDRDTSGAMVIARSDRAYARLTEQFREREIEKHYRTLAHGIVPPHMTEISAPIGRSRSDRKKMSTQTHRGRHAVTQLQVIETYEAATLLDVTLITGRTHQIRVHLASKGHPVLGDSVYGKKTSLMILGKKVPVMRQMLHSFSLGFVHPARDEFVTFQAPLPDDILSLIKALKTE